MLLNDRQQFEVAMRAVLEGLIDSDQLLSALDDWRQPPGDQSTLQEILLLRCPRSSEHREKLSQLFTDAASMHSPGSVNVQVVKEPDAKVLNADAVVRLRQLMQEEPQESHHSSRLTGLLPTEANTSKAGADSAIPGTESFNSQITRLLIDHNPSKSDSASIQAQSRTDGSEANRFRLMDQVAAGGLGEIYLADDQQLHRTVAVKKIRQRHSDLPIAREKFTLEAEVTGQLEHPGIVPVYALGMDPHGQPYYAMRFITGQNLAACIAAFHAQFQSQVQPFDGLALRQMLRRFLDVCNALEYAHSRCVVHRDLKPDNVMVGEHGETLVVDWGLAKVVSEAATVQSSLKEPMSTLVKDSALHSGARTSGRTGLRLSGSSDKTRLGSFLGTVRYAPPEQLMGLIDDIDARSDVYSLGAILYEILTGYAPLDATYRDPLLTCTALREGKLVAPRELNPQTPRGLEAICLMAMSVSKSARYATARELALDVERWLADDRVLAYRHGEPLAERAGRWLRKHRSWTFAIGSSLILITIGAIIAGTFINRARFSERLARNDAEQFKSDAVSRYRAAKSAIDNLVQRSEELENFPNSNGLRQQLLEEAASVFQSLGESVSQDPELQIERIRAMVRLADVYNMIRGVTNTPERYDPYQQYEAALEAARAALDQNSSASTRTATRLSIEIEIGRTLSRIGLAHDMDGDSDQARPLYRQAVDLLGGLERKHPESIEAAGNLAITLANQASMEDRLDAHALAVQLLEQALARFEKRGVSSQTLFALPCVRALEAYVRALRSVGRHQDAARQLARVEAALAELLRAEPNNWRYREARASLFVSAAASCQAQGDFVNGLSLLSKASEAYDRLRQERPDSLDYQHFYALSRLDEGLARIELREYATAAEDTREAFELLAEWSQRCSWLDELRLEAAVALDAHANALSLQSSATNDVPTISAMFEDAQQTVQSLMDGIDERQRDEQRDRLHDAQMTAISHIYRAAHARSASHYAEHLARNHQRQPAQEQFERALAELELIHSHNKQSIQARSDLAYTSWTAGSFMYEQGDMERARGMFQKAAELWRGLLIDAATPLHQYYLARLLLHCPIVDLRDETQAEVLLRLARQAVPTSQAFAEER